MNLVVSILIDSSEFKFIDKGEVNNIWSSLALNTSLPAFKIIWFPVYWVGDVGCGMPEFS